LSGRHRRRGISNCRRGGPAASRRGTPCARRHVASSSSRTWGSFEGCCAASLSETTWPPLRVSRRRREVDMPRPSRLGWYSLAVSLSSVLLPAPLGATGPVRPAPTVKERFWKTGESSGRRRQVGADDESVGHGEAFGCDPGGRDEAALRGTQVGGTTKGPRRLRYRAPACGLSPRDSPGDNGPCWRRSR
jgi:hypothetical protein